MKFTNPDFNENDTLFPLPLGDLLLPEDLGSEGGMGDAYLTVCEIPPVTTEMLPPVECPLIL